MGKQTGLFTVKGKVANVTFYKTQDGYQVRKRGGVDSKRVATDPKFIRTRENGAEFSRAGQACKQVRIGLTDILSRSTDTRSAGRLTAAFLQVVKSDPVNIRGMRTVIHGDKTLLKGFQFNINSPLDSGLKAPYSATINRETGLVNIKVPEFNPDTAIIMPDGSTHYQLTAAALEVDFTAPDYKLDVKKTMPAVVNAAPVAIDLSCQLPANSTHPLFAILGIQYFMEVNGKFYPGGANSLAIIEVSNG